jgi:AraC-like DNA-binding protein
MVEIVLNSTQGVYKFQVQDQIADAIMLTIEEFTQDYHRIGTNKTLLFSDYLKIILAKIERRAILQTEDLSKNTNQLIFQKFICLVERDLFLTRKVSYYCSCLGVSPRKLAEVCNEFRRKSSKNILDERLISECRFLLVETAYSIKNIASLTGFSDQYQFSKFFKKHVRVSPSRYRELYTKA